MSTNEDFQDLIDQINGVWGNPPARDGLFGNVLRGIGIQGIRGLNARIEFKWPVTAIAGTNGSGKTTFLQVASAAYVPNDGGHRVNLGSWIRNALQGDTPPIQLPASIAYSFVDTTPSFEVPYLAARTRWGYPRRNNPVRNVEFVGITTFAPRVEKKDRVHHARGSLQVLETKEPSRQIRESVSRILGISYVDLKEHKVGVAGKWDDLVPQLSRGSTSYSEPHMGAGEQKVVRLVQTIENIPKKSLILLEEPELTLHPDAQVGLAWYLMAVARRNGHQILIATHSEHLFQALPTQARVLLIRTAAGQEVLHDVSTLRAARELTNSMRDNAPLIVVEDEAARAFLLELFRQTDIQLRNQCAIISVGNDDDVRRLTASLQSAQVRVVGVRDGDVGEAPADSLLSLPGGASPETLLLKPENIRRADESFISGAERAFQRAEVVGSGHPPAQRDKRVLSQMAKELLMTPEDLATRLTQIWLLHHREEASALTRRINTALGDPES